VKLSRCPSKDDIIRYFEGAVAEVQAKRLLAHVLSCPECMTVFEAVQEIRSQSREILGGLEGFEEQGREARDRLRDLARREILLLRKSRRPRKRMSFRRLFVPAFGTALALLAVWVVAPHLGPRLTSVLERDGSPLEIGLVRPRGQVPRSALTFEWTIGPEAQSYRLEIYDGALEPVYQSGPLGAGPYPLSGDAAALLRTEAVYFWKVVAALKDGRTIGSEFAKFSLQK
jgi:hypothetical protein